MCAPRCLAVSDEILECRQDILVVGVLEVGLEVVGGEDRDQCLDAVVVLLVGRRHDVVGVLLDSCAICCLDSNSVGDMQSCLDCVVAIDDSEVDVLELAGDSSCLDLDEVQAVGVLCDIDRRCLEVLRILEGDKALLLKEQERPAFGTAILAPSAMFLRSEDLPA